MEFLIFRQACNFGALVASTTAAFATRQSHASIESGRNWLLKNDYRKMVYIPSILIPKNIYLYHLLFYVIQPVMIKNEGVGGLPSLFTC